MRHRLQGAAVRVAATHRVRVARCNREALHEAPADARMWMPSGEGSRLQAPRGKGVQKKGPYRGRSGCMVRNVAGSYRALLVDYS